MLLIALPLTLKLNRLENHCCLYLLVPISKRTEFYVGGDGGVLMAAAASELFCRDVERADNGILAMRIPLKRRSQSTYGNSLECQVKSRQQIQKENFLLFHSFSLCCRASWMGRRPHQQQKASSEQQRQQRTLASASSST